MTNNEEYKIKDGFSCSPLTFSAGCGIPTSFAREKFDISAVRVNDYAFDVDLPELPETYYIGITLCERINRFYELHVESL